MWVRGALAPCRWVVSRSSVRGARGGRGLPVKEPGLIASYGKETSAAVDPVDPGWPVVAVRAGVGLVYSVLIEEVVTPSSVGGRTGVETMTTGGCPAISGATPIISALSAPGWPSCPF